MEVCTYWLPIKDYVGRHVYNTNDTIDTARKMFWLKDPKFVPNMLPPSCNCSVKIAIKKVFLILRLNAWCLNNVQYAMASGLPTNFLSVQLIIFSVDKLLFYTWNIVVMTTPCRLWTNRRTKPRDCSNLSNNNYCTLNVRGLNLYLEKYAEGHSVIHLFAIITYYNSILVVICLVCYHSSALALVQSSRLMWKWHADSYGLMTHTFPSSVVCQSAVERRPFTFLMYVFCQL